jgi:hypothetical protein
LFPVLVIRSCLPLLAVRHGRQNPACQFLDDKNGALGQASAANTGVIGVIGKYISIRM